MIFSNCIVLVMHDDLLLFLNCLYKVKGTVNICLSYFRIYLAFIHVHCIDNLIKTWSIFEAFTNNEMIE